ncbi:cytosolic protein [Bifidobacterium anseris]|uniref:Cytosolic protein n=1 Tax=Bifidobacterium anseris TaxID=2020963 RepID=A0A2N5IXT2_9BIFI|nr:MULTISPECIES: phasin family protein [Bifidobacterium]PLS26750.1 cytosolic protein [Bifidobacterium anseris]
MTDSNNNIPDFGEGLRKIFLAGVGAIATTAEKGQELVNRLVERGELTVEQGKQLNSELAHKAGDKKESLKEKAAQASQTVQDAAAGLRNQAAQAVDDLNTKPADDAAADAGAKADAADADK